MKSPEAGVRHIISTHLGVPMDQVVREARLDELGADSLGQFELSLMYEEYFSISIPDEDLDKLGTVGDTIDYVTQRLA